MSKRTPGLYRRHKAGRHEWHIDKWIKHHGRLVRALELTMKKKPNATSKRVDPGRLSPRR